MWTLIILFGGLLTNPCFSQSVVTLEIQPWPVSKKCEICVPVQFGKLEMHLPLSEIERILVIGRGDSIMHIIPKMNSPKVGFHFISVSPDKLIGLYKKSGLLQGLDVKTNEQLFDILGKLPGKNKSLATMRRLKDIDTAKRYIKTSKDSVHVYWIQSPLPEGSQRIYFVIDGEETVYLLAGDVTQKFYEAVLSNLRIVDIP
jgi:hypothetical protein